MPPRTKQEHASSIAITLPALYGSFSEYVIYVCPAGRCSVEDTTTVSLSTARLSIHPKLVLMYSPEVLSSTTGIVFPINPSVVPQFAKLGSPQCLLSIEYPPTFTNNVVINGYACRNINQSPFINPTNFHAIGIFTTAVFFIKGK